MTECPYPLRDPPDGLQGEFLTGSLVNARFSGVVYINVQRDWDEWRVRLEKIARERSIRMGLKAWYDPTLAERESDEPFDPSAAQVIVQLQVDDPGLPDEHRVKTYEAAANMPQRAMWHALHAAGLVLEPELP